MADISDSPNQHSATSAQSSAQLQQQQQQQQTQIPQTSQQQSQHNLDANGQLLTIRLLMQGKEVGSIIGKKGDNIKRFREVSGAKINVSDSSCLDRIVTLAGTLDEVHNAFSLICSKFEEQILQVSSNYPSVVRIDGVDLPTPAQLLSSAEANNAADGSIGNSVVSSSNSGAGNPLNMMGNAGNQAPSSITDPLFGLPSTNILKNALKVEPKEAAELLTMNNNSTTTINNNNITALNKNILSTTETSILGGKGLSSSNSPNSLHPTVTFRLIVPASQCGSLIGRGGSKIKEIRDVTGATIQVAPDVLPNSTERVVTISGNVESLRSCAYNICKIIVESPAKGYVLPYRPKPALNPMLLAAATAGQAAGYTLPGQFGLSAAHPDVNRLFVSNSLAAAFNNPATAANLRAAAVSGQAAAALSVVASRTMSSQEMAIPNGLIGCVIGKGGSKINEIRQLSGATIKISNSEEGAKNRTVTINGTPEAINLAHYLITAR